MRFNGQAEENRPDNVRYKPSGLPRPDAQQNQTQKYRGGQYNPGASTGKEILPNTMQPSLSPGYFP